MSSCTSYPIQLGSSWLAAGQQQKELLTLRFERKDLRPSGAKAKAPVTAPSAVILGALEEKGVDATLHLWRDPQERGVDLLSLAGAKGTTSHVGRTGPAGLTDCLLIFDPLCSRYTLERVTTQINDLRPAHAMAAANRPAPAPIDLKKRKQRSAGSAEAQAQEKMSKAAATPVLVPGKAPRARRRIESLVRDLHELFREAPCEPTLGRRPGKPRAEDGDGAVTAPAPRGRPPKGKQCEDFASGQRLGKQPQAGDADEAPLPPPGGAGGEDKCYKGKGKHKEGGLSQEEAEGGKSRTRAKNEHQKEKKGR